MKRFIKIIHIDNNFEVIYIIIFDGTVIKSTVSLEKAIEMLKHDQFDLILSEPQQIAILDPQKPSEIPSTISDWKTGYFDTIFADSEAPEYAKGNAKP